MYINTRFNLSETVNLKVIYTENKIKTLNWILGKSYLYKTKHAVRDISACNVTLQIDAQNDETKVMAWLFAQLCSSSFYQNLRTKLLILFIFYKYLVNFKDRLKMNKSK